MSNDKFVWDENKVKEFWKYCYFNVFKQPTCVEDLIEQFKREQLSKRDWDVLSFKSKNRPDWTWDLKENGMYRNNIGSEFSYGRLMSDEPNSCVKNGDFWIHSVRRLSDGEVLAVGDEDEKYGKIESFYIQSNKWMLAKCGDARVFIEDFKKAKKKVLFTTEDHFDCYGGEVLYGAAEQATCNDAIIEGRIPFSRNGQRTNRKWFKIKEAAEQYILLNRPMLSVNDFVSMFAKNQLDISENQWIESELKQLAKDKLNAK